MNPTEIKTKEGFKLMIKIVYYLIGTALIAAIGAFVDLQLLKHSFAQAKEEVRSQKEELNAIKNVVCFMAIKDFQSEKLPEIVVRNCLNRR